MKLLQLHIDDDMHREIKTLALEQGISIRTLMIAAYLTHRALLQDAGVSVSGSVPSEDVKPRVPALPEQQPAPPDMVVLDTLADLTEHTFGRTPGKPCKKCGALMIDGKCLQKHG